MDQLFEMLLQQQPQNGYSSLAPPASRLAIQELEDVDLENVKDFSKLKNDTCPVCNEKFKREDVYLKRLPCGHLFHELECLLPWLAKTNTCPMCRLQLPTLNAEFEARKHLQKQPADDDDSFHRPILSSLYR